MINEMLRSELIAMRAEDLRVRWCRSETRRQFRSGSQRSFSQSTEVGGRKRAHHLSSARCCVRGVTRVRRYGVAELGAGGPIRRSSLVSRMQRTGPPPCSFVANLRGPLQDGQAAKTKPLTRSCLRFWTRAWSQRGLVGEGTGRLRSPAAKRAFPRVSWTFLPSTSVMLTNTVMNTQSGRLTHRSRSRAGRERNALRANSCLLAQETPPVVHQLVEQSPDQSAVPSRVVGRFLKLQARARHE
jgi:hypothetical protein